MIQPIDYQVGPHTFRIQKDVAIKLSEAIPALAPFTVPANPNQEIIFNVTIDDRQMKTEEKAPQTEGDICFDWEDADCTIRPLPGEAHLIFITPRSSGKAYCMECSHGFRQCTVHLPDCQTEDAMPGSASSFVLNNFLMMLYAFNAARLHTLLMHASVIVSGGKGYLFLGKSGTGKSTHTSLWLKHIPGCHLLNDDNPIVHTDTSTGEVTVYGSPWSGKTPCYLQESAPAGAFVRLEQAPQNEIKRESTVPAFADLLPSCSCLKQDKEIYREIISTVTDLASLTPVFRLKCLPNREAAELCRNTVTAGGQAVTGNDK